MVRSIWHGLAFIGINLYKRVNIHLPAWRIPHRVPTTQSAPHTCVAKLMQGLETLNLVVEAGTVHMMKAPATGKPPVNEEGRMLTDYSESQNRR